MTAENAPLTTADVAALIPAYQEERHIAGVVHSTNREVAHTLVIDDGSDDATAKLAKEAGAEVVRHPQNRGKGAAIKTGLEILLQRPFRCFILLDADGQHLPIEIPRFIDEANRSLHSMVIGSRMSETRRMPPVRRLTNRIMSWCISRICRQHIPDTQCGFRLVHREIAPLLFCQSNAYDYETEMLFIISRAGHRISSVPISTVYADEVSKIRPLRDSIRFARLMMRYW